MTPPDVPARIGVPLVAFVENGYWWLPRVPLDAQVDHLAYPVTPEAVAEMRERIALEIFEATNDFLTPLNDFESEQVADAVLRALGFDGGAS